MRSHSGLITRYAGVDVRVRLHAKWGRSSAEEIRARFGEFGDSRRASWEGIQLVADDDYDVMVLFDRGLGAPIDPDRTIVVSAESAPVRERLHSELPAARESFREFFDVERHHVILPWQVPYAAAARTHTKTASISAVVSSLQNSERHRSRLAFATGPLTAVPGYEHFGRGTISAPRFRGPIDAKWQALSSYRYTFNAENWFEPGYFTEKLLDAILCETLCFYDGCPNAELFVDPETFVPIDVSDPEHALDSVQTAISEGLWEQRLPAIREQRERLLELNPLELIRRIVLGLPIVWRPGRPWYGSGKRPQVSRIDAGDPRAKREALEGATATRARTCVLVDDRAALVDRFADVAAAIEAHLRPGDAAILGGLRSPSKPVTGMAVADQHVLYRPPLSETLKPSAMMLTAGAARSLACSGRLEHRSTLYAVWPPIAYVPGPFLRRDGTPDAPIVSLKHGLLGRAAASMVDVRNAVTRPTSRRRRQDWSP